MGEDFVFSLPMCPCAPFLGSIHLLYEDDWGRVSVNGMLPGYISDLFVVRNNVKCLRGTNKLAVPRKKNFKLWPKIYNFYRCQSVEFFTG